MINIKKWKCAGRLNASLLGSARGTIMRCSRHGTSGRLAASITAVIASAMTLPGVQLQEAHAHVSHVLSAQQYGDIKSGHPEIEMTAAVMTGLVVVGAVLVQTLQRRGREMSRMESLQ